MARVSLGNWDYEFETHSGDRYPPLFLAVAVKNCGWGYEKLMFPDDQAKLKQLTEERRLELEERAFESAREDWWEWARELAEERGLGTVSSAGRNGGWLVLEKWPTDKLDELREEFERECVHCEATWEDHVRGQCLFDSSEFLSREHAETVGVVEKIQAYLEEVKASAKGAHADLASYMALYLEEEEIEECAHHAERD